MAVVHSTTVVWGLAVCKQVFREQSLSTRFELPSLLKSRPSHLTSSLDHLFLKQKLQFKFVSVCLSLEDKISNFLVK